LRLNFLVQVFVQVVVHPKCTAKNMFSCIHSASSHASVCAFSCTQNSSVFDPLGKDRIRFQMHATYLVLAVPRCPWFRTASPPSTSSELYPPCLLTRRPSVPLCPPQSPLPQPSPVLLNPFVPLSPPCHSLPQSPLGHPLVPLCLLASHPACLANRIP
jgi:hypothetical protein